jgi:hypothetical protein
MNRRIEAVLLFTLVAMVPIARGGQLDSPKQVVTRPGTFSFVDGGGSLSAKQYLVCGPASGFAMTGSGPGQPGPFTIDLSFGVLPAGDRLGDIATVIGSWVVRSPAAAIFDGGVSSGTILPSKGGGTVYELYGFTHFTGTTCNGFGRVTAGADYSTRNPVRIYGACGNDQEITFELSRRPLVTDKNGFRYFDEAGVLSRGTFRGNVTCGQTADRNQVRVNLSRPR